MARTAKHRECVGNTLPSRRTVQKDVCEWWCYAVLQDTASSEVFDERVDAMEAALRTLCESTEDDSIGSHGRAVNRILIASLFADLRQTLTLTQGGDDDDENDPRSELKPTEWKEWFETLLKIRAGLLCKDANANDEDPRDETVDENLAALPKFSKDFDTVATMLKIHETAATFRQALEKLVSPRAKRDLLHKVEAAVDDYKDALTKLEIEDLGGLTTFLLKDMYKTKAKDLKELPAMLIKDLQDSLADEDMEYGYANVLNKTLRLLQRWHACVLSTPTLVRCGYGGFTRKNSIPILEARRSSLFDENASVSSWGVDAEELKERRQSLQDITGDDVDTDEYATADEAEVEAAFSTQPPEEFPLPGDDSQDENQPPESNEKGKEEEDSNETPSAKSTENQPPESTEKGKEKEDSDETPNVKSTAPSIEQVEKDGMEPHPRLKPASAQPRRSSRLAGEEHLQATTQSKQAKSLQSPHRRASAATTTEKENKDHNDESITDPVASVHKPKKPKSIQLEWLSSDSEQDDNVPTPRKRRRSSFSGSIRNRTKSPKPQKRRVFALEEKQAIRDGVRQFGAGQWAMIRFNSNGILLSRTGVQIKDCYRNMCKRGEI